MNCIVEQVFFFCFFAIHLPPVEEGEFLLYIMLNIPIPAMIVNRCLLYVFVRVELRFPLYLPPTAVLGTAFAIFPICRLSLLYTCDCIRTIFHLQILFPSEPVTAFTIFPICRLSLLYTCDCIRTFFHLQIIFPSEPVTAFTIILICRLSLLYTCDRICNFSHL